jgi:hypothetical protein
VRDWALEAEEAGAIWLDDVERVRDRALEAKAETPWLEVVGTVKE